MLYGHAIQALAGAALQAFPKLQVPHAMIQEELLIQTIQACAGKARRLKFAQKAQKEGGAAQGAQQTQRYPSLQFHQEFAIMD